MRDELAGTQQALEVAQAQATAAGSTLQSARDAIRAAESRAKEVRGTGAAGTLGLGEWSMCCCHDWEMRMVFIKVVGCFGHFSIGSRVSSRSRKVVLSTGEAPPQALHSVLGLSLHERHWDAGACPKKGKEAGEGSSTSHVRSC